MCPQRIERRQRKSSVSRLGRLKMANEVQKTDQYALLALIIEKQGGERGRLGKKALQKFVHLIQEFGGVDSKYQFSFYTYGPYSSGLAGDLDILSALDGADIVYNATDNHYQISAGAYTSELIKGG